eukprot:1922124-Pyramimonas_sp.AAC.1
MCIRDRSQLALLLPAGLPLTSGRGRMPPRSLLAVAFFSDTPSTDRGQHLCLPLLPAPARAIKAMFQSNAKAQWNVASVPSSFDCLKLFGHTSQGCAPSHVR